jgi:hypothetical protein
MREERWCGWGRRVGILAVFLGIWGVLVNCWLKMKVPVVVVLVVAGGMSGVVG